MWLSIVPLLVIGVFLFFVWDTISPAHLIKKKKTKSDEK